MIFSYLGEKAVVFELQSGLTIEMFSKFLQLWTFHIFIWKLNILKIFSEQYLHLKIDVPATYTFGGEIISCTSLYF